MASLTDILLLIDLATGESSYDVYANWGEVTDENISRIEAALGEVTAKTVTTANVTLTDDETRSSFIHCSGALTGNRSVIAPNRKGFWFVKNDCTGAFSLTFKNSSGTGVVIDAGTAITAVCDGSQMYSITPTLPEEIGASGILTKLLTVDGSGSLLDADLVDGLHASEIKFPVGTLMLFQQTAAPTGWTKQTTHNDKALRVVSGSVSSGGTVAFSTAFASKSVAGSVGSTTLTAAQIPSHTHAVSGSTGTESANHTHAFSGTTGSENATHTHGFTDFGAGGIGLSTGSGGTQNRTGSAAAATGGQSANHQHAFSGSTGTVSAFHTHSFSVTSGSAGSDGSHTHSFTGTAIDLTVQYVDLIIAAKD